MRRSGFEPSDLAAFSKRALRLLQTGLSIASMDLLAAMEVPDELLEEHFGDFLEAAHRNGTPDDPKKWVAEIVASQKRVAYVSALSDFGIHVWGADRWSEISVLETGRETPAPPGRSR